MAPSPEEIRIVTDALLAEAGKWAALSDDVATVRQRAAGLDLAPTAFFVGNLVTTGPAKAAYDALQDRVIALLGQAATEFDQLDQALRRAADRYDESDGRAAVDLTAIYGG